ncbi:MAG TPA: hypothetical protein VK434_10315 [Microvirga sp.]|nr:hypothetical protein [Microvirga sp.]
MIESIMIFALGFVAASLIALLIIPAINARAERLARRRAEALFPMSISELTAEKDHLRAEFAVLQRQIERKAEDALAAKHQSMEELGRRAVRIDALESTLSERDQTIKLLEGSLSDTQERLNAVEEELAGIRIQLSGNRAALSALETAHGATLDELSNTRMELESVQKDRTEIGTALIQTQERLARLEAEYGDADGRLSAALSELDTKRITISDLETRLMTQTARGNDFERALGERHSQLSDERKRLAELARSLAAEQERGLILEQRIREIEAERDEVRGPAAPAANLDERNEELRRRITEVADQVMKNGGTTRQTGKSQDRKRRRSAQAAS